VPNICGGISLKNDKIELPDDEHVKTLRAVTPEADRKNEFALGCVEARQHTEIALSMAVLLSGAQRPCRGHTAPKTRSFPK